MRSNVWAFPRATALVFSCRWFQKPWLLSLACGLIGAIYIPMFSGYGAEAVASRLRDCDAKLLITANGFNRRGKFVPLKETADIAMAVAPSVECCIVLDQPRRRLHMQEGRDRWWGEVMRRAFQPTSNVGLSPRTIRT